MPSWIYLHLLWCSVFLFRFKNQLMTMTMNLNDDDATLHIYLFIPDLFREIEHEGGIATISAFFNVYIYIEYRIDRNTSHIFRFRFTFFSTWIFFIKKFQYIWIQLKLSEWNAFEFLTKRFSIFIRFKNIQWIFNENWKKWSSFEIRYDWKIFDNVKPYWTFK